MVSSKSIFTLRAEGGGLGEVREIFPSKSSIIYVREGIKYVSVPIYIKNDAAINSL